MKTSSNSLIYTISENNKNVNCLVKIRLNDECKNGHQDFSVTATFWEIGKQRTDKNLTCAGCCHDEILKHFPELKIFVDLHLCDFSGIPMHASANGFYHLSKGFENLNGKTQKEYFCEYYRVNPAQYDKLLTAKDEKYFGFLLIELGVLDQWKKQADKAIKELERLTEIKFLNDSKRTNFLMTPEEIENISNLIKTGFYSTENIEKREAEKKQAQKEKILSELEAERKKSTDKANTEYTVKHWLFLKLNTLENIIYYNHSNEVSFNWVTYGKKWSEAEFKNFCHSITQKDFEKLPKGIKFTIKDIKLEFSNI